MSNLNADNFHEVAFKFRKFNLVCGLNGVGKTEMIDGVIERRVVEDNARCVSLSGSGTPFLTYREGLFELAIERLQDRPTRIEYLLNLITEGVVGKVDALTIEHPEMGLHPSKQSELVRRLIELANNGVQVILETHSDHILNAMRVAIVDGLISHEDVRILWVVRSDDTYVDWVEVDKDGRIDHWPNGFFDQHNKDLLRLLNR